MVKDFISYEQVVSLVDSVIGRVKAENIQYDYVVGFGRGGLIPATLFAYKLDIPVLCFAVASYTGNQQGEFRVHQEINFDSLAPGTKILVIDDICDTGDTFRFFKSMNKPNVGTIKYAALFAKQSSESIIDYYGMLADANTWLVFPWEVDNE